MTLLMVGNIAGLLASVILVGFVAGRDAALAAQVTQAIRHSIRMFAVGAFVPIVPVVICWVDIELAIPASRRVVTWSVNAVLLISGALFVIAAWGLPQALLRAFGAD